MKINILIVLFLSTAFLVQAQNEKQSAESYFTSGEEAMRSGKLSEALIYFNRAIAENPGYVEAYSSRAIIKERFNDNKGALEDYTICLELLPDQYEVLLGRAALRFQLGQFVFDRDDFRKLLSLPEGETNTIFYRRSAHSPGTDQMLTVQGAIRSQLFSYLGLIEYELGNCEGAIIYLDSAINLNKTEADYFVNRALAKLECDPTKALDDFKQALELNPDHIIARHNLAVAAAHQGKYELAEQQLTEAIQLDSMMLDPYLERGYYRMLKRDYLGALSDYNRAIILEKDDPEIWLNRGFVKEKLNDWRGAYFDYSKAIDLKENYSKAWLNRGNLLTAQFRYGEAIEDYSVAITFQPDYSAAYFNRAMVWHKSGKPHDACKDLNEAIRLGMEVDPTIKRKICANNN